MSNRRFLTAALICALCGCAAATPKTGEVGEPSDGRYDSFREPTDKGTLVLGDELVAELSDEEQFHAFHFELSGPAEVRLQSKDAGEPELDTVFYLYRQQSHGWGSYIDKDDDGGDAYFSRIETTLDAGRYRLLVKGYDTYQDLGPYLLESACAGDGCASAPRPRLSDECLFGETYGDFRDSPNFENVESRDLRADTELGELLAAQIMATFEAYGDSISEPSQAFERVDEGYINYATVRDRFDGHEYTSLEFGAGDNGFGAILDGGTAHVLAAIQDSYLEGCETFEPVDRWRVEVEAIEPEASLAETFPGRIYAMRLTGGFEPGHDLAVSTHDQLVNAARGVVNARNECTGFPDAGQTELEDYWDPWYVDRWMGAGHVQEGWVDAPTTEQRAALQAYFEARGTENITGYQGEFESDACGGSGAGYFFLFLDETSGDVTILIVYRWTD
jgi:hypothetical protein